MLQFAVPFLGYTALGGGLTALGTGTLGRAFKDQMGWSELDAAREELAQGKYKGYRTSDGEINRSWMEQLRDGLLGNDPEEIRRLAQDLQKDNMQSARGTRVAEANRKIREAGGKEFITIDHTSTVDKLDAELERLGVKAGAVLQGQADAPDAGITMDTPTPQIAVLSREGRRQEGNRAMLESPEYQRMLNQQNFTNQMAVGQMAIANQNSANQMAIAQMNNQLQMRREDRAMERDERKDRQQMIMMLMKGLGQMGQGFAI